MEEANQILKDFKNGDGEIIDYHDFGPNGGGINQIDVKFDNHTAIFYTRDLKTGKMVGKLTNVFRIKGSGNAVKIFPINPDK